MFPNMNHVLKIVYPRGQLAYPRGQDIILVAYPSCMSEWSYIDNIFKTIGLSIGFTKHVRH